MMRLKIANLVKWITERLISYWSFLMSRFGFEKR